MTTPLLQGKTGLVFGVANDRSYAWHIASALIAHGARCAFQHLPGDKNERRTRMACEKIEGAGDLTLYPCDASKDEDLDSVFDAYTKKHERLDFVIHSIAFADREWLSYGKFTETPREAYLSAIDISAYTLAAMAHRAAEPMKATGGGSILAMSYYGAEKIVPGYNVMGVAKAALECTMRYLAGELGQHNIRVNTISGGPLKTLASSAVGGIGAMLESTPIKAPLKRNVEGADVGGAAVFLVSDLASGITAENIYVDCGVNAVGV
ncbi:MAG: enoyl-ACP reductase [Phycisphaeraceae bacterium]|nr:enoyl-ACP reductase [Phycisphaeraceae bacterium]